MLRLMCLGLLACSFWGFSWCAEQEPESCLEAAVCFRGIVELCAEKFLPYQLPALSNIVLAITDGVKACAVPPKKRETEFLVQGNMLWSGVLLIFATKDTQSVYDCLAHGIEFVRTAHAGAETAFSILQSQLKRVYAKYYQDLSDQVEQITKLHVERTRLLNEAWRDYPNMKKNLNEYAEGTQRALAEYKDRLQASLAFLNDGKQGIGLKFCLLDFIEKLRCKTMYELFCSYADDFVKDINQRLELRQELMKKIIDLVFQKDQAEQKKDETAVKKIEQEIETTRELFQKLEESLK